MNDSPKSSHSAVVYFFYLPVAIMVLFLVGAGVWAVFNSSLTIIENPTVMHASSAGVTIVYEEGEGQLKGTIVMEDGRPNTEEIMLNYRSYRTTESGGGYSKSASIERRTDSFDVKAASGDVYLIATGEHCAPSWIGPIENYADGVVDGLTLVLKKGNPLEIILTDQAGDPVLDAKVNGYPEIGDHGGGSHNPTTNLGDGIYQFPYTADATYTIYIEAPTFEPEKIIVGDAGNIGKYEHQLTKALPTEGTVVNHNGEPVMGAKILLELVHGPGTNHSYSAKEIATTNEDGKFLLNELSRVNKYHGYIEAPDQRRVCFDGIEAGKTGLVYKLPQLRILYGKIMGDLSQLKTRRFQGKKEAVPYVKIDQRYDIQLEKNHTSGQLVYDYQPVDILEQEEAEGHFKFTGLFAEDVVIQIGPYQFDFNPQDIAGKGDLQFRYNLDTGENSITTLTE